MKNKTIALLSIAAIALLAGCSQETIDEKQLVERNGKVYKINSEIPLSGTAVDWHENGQKAFEGTYKDGKPDGIWTTWDEDGNNVQKATWKDGQHIK